MSKEDVHAYIMQDEDLFHWDNLSDQLCHETARTLLKDIIDLWLTIRGHAFVKQAIEGHKADIYIYITMCQTQSRATNKVYRIKV